MATAALTAAVAMAAALATPELVTRSVKDKLLLLLVSSSLSLLLLLRWRGVGFLVVVVVVAVVVDDFYGAEREAFLHAQRHGRLALRGSGAGGDDHLGVRAGEREGHVRPQEVRRLAWRVRACGRVHTRLRVCARLCVQARPHTRTHARTHTRRMATLPHRTGGAAAEP